MLAQLAPSIVWFIPLYHACRTFEFINTSPLQEHAFVLKNVASLKTFLLDTIDIMCSSTIDKYIKRPIYLTFLLLNLLQLLTLKILGKKEKISYNLLCAL
jgi:hypothetical protein